MEVDTAAIDTARVAQRTGRCMQVIGMLPTDHHPGDAAQDPRPHGCVSVAVEMT